jgi:hypothetical protein
MSFFAQLSAVAFLVDFFLGVACGIIGSAIHGSRCEDRGYTLLGAAPDPVSAGARVLYGVYTGADAYMMGLFPAGGAGEGNRGIDNSAAQGQESDQ